MRSLLRILIFSVTAITLNAEESMPPSEFAKSSLEDAKKAVVAAELSSALLEGYATAAVESKRPELATLCFENPRIAHAFDHAVSKLPDSLYQEELMLMMLKPIVFLEPSV